MRVSSGQEQSFFSTQWMRTMEETKVTLLHQLDTILQQHNVLSTFKEGLDDPNYTLQHKQFSQVSILSFIVVIHTLHVANSYTILAST